MSFHHVITFSVNSINNEVDNRQVMLKNKFNISKWYKI